MHIPPMGQVGALILCCPCDPWAGEKAVSEISLKFSALLFNFSYGSPPFQCDQCRAKTLLDSFGWPPPLRGTHTQCLLPLPRCISCDYKGVFVKGQQCDHSHNV